MQKQIELGESVGLTDLRNDVLEAKQASPIPPYYFDSTCGFGLRPCCAN